MAGKPLLVKICWHPVETMLGFDRRLAASRYGQNSALMRQGVRVAPVMNAVEEEELAPEADLRSRIEPAPADPKFKIDPYTAVRPNAALMPGYKAPAKASSYEAAPAEEAPARTGGLWGAVRNCLGAFCPKPKSEGGRRRSRRQRRQSRQGRGRRQTRNRFQ